MLIKAPFPAAAVWCLFAIWCPPIEPFHMQCSVILYLILFPGKYCNWPKINFATINIYFNYILNCFYCSFQRKANVIWMCTIIDLMDRNYMHDITLININNAFIPSFFFFVYPPLSVKRCHNSKLGLFAYLNSLNI